eukprot:TRINITY_DN12247_c0_g5_i1.p1 TRINITY_DN12247_c0_g5~~TRINITY_DN12247_c0_g5_i1.p1  ORF type:complete len:489 (+),score=74.13 TRINITY_DN12247_c0_g5_i1:143-1609(+)
MEFRKDEFKPLLHKDAMVQQLFKYAQETARLRKQHVINAKRLISENENENASIKEFYECYKPIEEALLPLAVTVQNSATVHKLIKKLVKFLTANFQSEMLKTPLVISRFINFIDLLMMRWVKYSDIMYVLLKSLLIFSVNAYVFESPFCELLPALERIMALPNANSGFVQKELIVWSIGNMSSDCPQFIALVTKSPVFVPQMIELVGYNCAHLRSTCLWALFCLTKSELVQDKGIFATPLLLSQLTSIIKRDNEKEKENAVWILANISQHIMSFDSTKLLALINTLLEQLNRANNFDCYKGILRFLGSFLAADMSAAECTKRIVDSKELYCAMDRVIKVPALMKECVWILSLLAADPVYCDNIGKADSLLSFLQSQLNESTEYHTRKEILLTLYYLARNRSEHIKSIGNEIVLNYCIWTLNSHITKDAQLVTCILSIIDLVIDILPNFIAFLKNAGGKEAAERIIYVYEENSQISLLAQTIVQKLTSY